MDRTERAGLVTAALAELAAQGEGYAIFIDTQQPDNFVQVSAEGTIEVTSRNYRSSRLPRLSDEQLARVATLGLSVEASPNHQGTIDLGGPAAVAALVEELFAILGAPPDFSMEVESGV